ncbi:MAG: alginate export family protein [Armatimonadetes bacterium]|nr:alginate export family protein [Armatimonadota bacterium]MDW8027767.1 alginate export family protein [Armatimonadota bacterium]
MRAATALALCGFLAFNCWGQGLKIDVTSRFRFESWDFFEAANLDKRYNFWSSLLRLELSEQQKQFESKLELAQVTLGNLPYKAILPTHGAAYKEANEGRDGGLFVKQLFWQFRNRGGNLFFRLGRFEFAEGLEGMPKDETMRWIRLNRIQGRLLGTFDFHIGRSFDGLLLATEKQKSSFTFALIRPTRGVFDLRGNDQLNQVTVGYASWVQNPDPQTDFRIFALYYRDKRKPSKVIKLDNRPIELRQNDTKPISVLTFGTHILRVLPDDNGKIDFLGWAAIQFGDWGQLKHKAFALATELGRKWQKPYQLWFRLGASLSTGDGNPNDKYHKTFFQILPSPTVYSSFPIYNMMNARELFIHLMAQPSDKLNLKLGFHRLWLSRKSDLWYSGGGAFNNESFGYLGLRGLGRRLMDIFELSLNYKHDELTELCLRLFKVWGKESVRANFLRTNATFAYLELLREW